MGGGVEESYLREQFKILTMFGANDAKVALVECTDLRDVQPFCDCHDAAVNEVQLGARVI